MRIPWLAFGSRVTHGDFSSPVNTMDTAATVLAALGLAVPDTMVGRPVRLAILDGPDAPQPQQTTPAASSESPPQATTADGSVD